MSSSCWISPRGEYVYLGDDLHTDLITLNPKMFGINGVVYGDPRLQTTKSVLQTAHQNGWVQVSDFGFFVTFVVWRLDQRARKKIIDFLLKHKWKKYEIYESGTNNRAPVVDSDDIGGILDYSPRFESLLEMAYPEGFSLEHFQNLESFKKRLEYAKEFLGELGTGTSRVVFHVDNKKVVKIAKNNIGLVQNQHEVVLYRKYKKILAKIYDSDNKYTWIEMELVKPFKTDSGWVKYTGVPMDIFKILVRTYIRKGYDAFVRVVNMYADSYDIMDDTLIYSEWFQEVVDMLKEVKLTSGDTFYVGHWGLTNDHRVVLFDYGLNYDDYVIHYGRTRALPSGGQDFP